MITPSLPNIFNSAEENEQSKQAWLTLLIPRTRRDLFEEAFKTAKIWSSVATILKVIDAVIFAGSCAALGAFIGFAITLATPLFPLILAGVVGFLVLAFISLLLFSIPIWAEGKASNALSSFPTRDQNNFNLNINGRQ